jgi:integrase
MERLADGHNTIARKLKPIGEACGIPWINWHCLRHTASTLAKQAGLTLTERKKMLGHSPDRMAEHYSHADLERMREGMENVAKGLTVAETIQ